MRGSVFSFLEAFVAGGLILGLAAIVYPVAEDSLQQRRRRAVEGECRRLAGVLERVREVTGAYPGEEYAYLVGPGDLPEGAGGLGPGGAPGSLARELERAWRSGRLGTSPPGVVSDPWGRAILVFPADAELPGHSGAVLSAGPDGIIQTARGFGRFRGDDVGARLPGR